MSLKVPIFSPAGSIAISTIPAEVSSYMTVSPVLKSGNKKSGLVLFAFMPISGVVIQQGVDMNVSKTLNSDFLVSEFGDNPVQITLTGINFYAVNLCGVSSKDQHKQVLDFYEENKLSANINNRIDIAITPGATPNSGAFRCVLTKLKTMNPISENFSNVAAYKYEMSLIGVRRK